MAQHLAACLQAAGAPATPATVLRGGPALWGRARAAALAQELALFRQAGGKAPYLRAAAGTSACASFLPNAGVQDGAAAAVAGAPGAGAAPGSTARHAGALALGDAQQASEGGPGRAQRACNAEAGLGGRAPAQHVGSGCGAGKRHWPDREGTQEQPGQAPDRPAKRARASGPQRQGCRPFTGDAATAQTGGVLEDADIAWDAPASSGSTARDHTDSACDAEGAAGSAADKGCSPGCHTPKLQPAACAGKAPPPGPRTAVGGCVVGMRPLHGAAAQATSGPAQPAAAQQRQIPNPEISSGRVHAHNSAALAAAGALMHGTRAGQPVGTGNSPAQTAQAAVARQPSGSRASAKPALCAHGPGESKEQASACPQGLGGLHAEARERRAVEVVQTVPAVAADVPDAAATGAAGAPAEACAHLPAIRRFVRALLDPLYDAQVLRPRLSWVCCIELKPCPDRPSLSAWHVFLMLSNAFRTVNLRAAGCQVVTREQYKLVAARACEKVARTHAGASSAVFLVHEADTIRKLVQHYIQHYAAMGVG